MPIRLRDLYLKWSNDERHTRAVLSGLLVLAFVLRLTAALIIPLDYRLRADAVEYVTDAHNLIFHQLLKRGEQGAGTAE